jgi:hypothetical protein
MIGQKMNEESPEFKDQNLFAELTKLVTGLMYVSETDCDVQPLTGPAVTNDDVTSAIAAVEDRKPVEEIDLVIFFSRLTRAQDWFGAAEKKRAERFARLQRFIEDNLRGIKVLKVGHVQKTIYVAGITPNNNLLGVKMDAVET